MEKYEGNMCNLHPLKIKSPKNTGRFSGLIFCKLTKFPGNHFRNLAVLSDRPTVFVKTVLKVVKMQHRTSNDYGNIIELSWNFGFEFLWEPCILQGQI